jgi:hypothetical protein
MKILQQLLQLQQLDLGPKAGAPATRREATALRQELPAAVLGHYDRLVSRGKKAVAVVRRGVCTGCQMRLPSGINAKLLRDDDISICDNCARYLMLAPEELAPAVPVDPPAPKRTVRRRPPAPAAVATPGLEPVVA